jgi:REP element-mobilizing transposase RayT
MESAPTLGTVIQAIKRNTTIKYINAVKNGEVKPFNGKLWQRNYYEHIIRDENEYAKIWKYIDDNPLNWESDAENLGV